MALPEGLHVLQGDVRVEEVGTSLQIETSDRALLEWESFSLDAGEITRFLQPSASATVLNKVVGLHPSCIEGVLESNGRVILVNPQGVLVGKQGLIRTAEFIASTLDVLDFQGDQISCEGEILFPDPSGSASFINLEGFIQATGVEGSGGRVVLVAPRLQIDGEVCAEQGSVMVLGQMVELGPHAHMDVSGLEGGGCVLIGAQAHGESLFHSRGASVWMQRGSEIIADARGSGDGGKVVLWGDRNAHVQGSIFARGGAAGGSGGWIEISSPEQLLFQGKVDTTAPQGNTGRLLLDPCNITIGMQATDPSPFTPLYQPTTSSAQILVTDLEQALATSHVEITTTQGTGAGAGDIAWEADAALSWSSGHSLTLVANNLVLLKAPLQCTGQGDVHVKAATIQMTQGSIETGGEVVMNARQGIALFPSADIQIQAGGPIVMEAAETILLGQAGNAGSISVQTTAASAPIRLMSTGSSGGVLCSADALDVTIQAFASPVQIQVAEGDLVLSSDQDGTIQLYAGEGLSVEAQNWYIDAHKESVITVQSKSSAGRSSSIQLKQDFAANAWGSTASQAGSYSLSFIQSPLQFIAGGKFKMDNQNPSSSVFQLEGCAATWDIGSHVHINGDCHLSGSAVMLGGLKCTGLQLTSKGDILVSNQDRSPASIQSGGFLSIEAQGDIAIQAVNTSPGEEGWAFIQAGSTAPLYLRAGGDIRLTGSKAVSPHARLIQGYAAPAVLIADRDIHFEAGCIDVDKTPGLADLDFASTLIVDNAFPSAPEMGEGSLYVDQNSYIYSVRGGAPQIFTSRRAQNTINGPIHGARWIPGAFDYNSPTEQWSTYYMHLQPYPLPYVGPIFTLFYKEPWLFPPSPPASALAVQAHGFDTLLSLRYPLPFFSNRECFSLKESAYLQGYWGRAPRGALVFDNTACGFVELNNYRKYAVERKGHF